MNYAKEIRKILDTYVQGQENVKDDLSCVLYKHFLKTFKHFNDGQTAMCKSNMLMLGPTGCGKTYMMNVIKQHINYPVVEINASDLSRPGWVGESLQDHISKAADNWVDKNLFKYAIIFIDEVDKICYPAISSGGDDVNKGLQQNLLKAVEGYKFNHRSSYIDTSNMLFVFGGNFKELRDKLMNQKASIGFNSEKPTLSLNDMHALLISCGMIQELAGRISVVSEVKTLTRCQLRKALLNEKAGPLTEYQKLLEFVEEKYYSISNYHINKILDECMKKDVGVRGLTAAVDNHFKSKLKDLELKDKLLVLKSELVQEKIEYDK